MTTPAIRFRGINKRFPGVAALTDVTFDVLSGSCHAVCGENGAGKSTLGKILAGLDAADSGSIEIDGQPVHCRSPREALTHGIAMVHQELAFCDNLTVADNLCLGALPTRFGMVDRPALNGRAREMLMNIWSSIDPEREMNSLSVAEQQVVQIAGAVGSGARVIVFDEPTSSLGEVEVSHLYALIGKLRQRGVSIIYVSHRMVEIFQLCDYLTVLRDGKHVTTQRTEELDEDALVHLMIGRAVEQYFPERRTVARGSEALRVTGLTRPGKFEDISFALHAGEVLGLAGLVGAGRSEISQAIFGLDTQVRGQVHVRGEAAQIGRPADAIALGVSYVPEDRKKQGLVLSMNTRENATLTILSQFTRFGLIDGRREYGAVNNLFGRLRVRATRNAPVSTLSGGNQQKVVLSKWLATGSNILMLDEPTRGVDVGVKAELHAWIAKKASEGSAILLVSSDLTELLHLSTRLLVLREGRMVGELSRAEATQDKLMRMMAGLSQ